MTGLLGAIESDVKTALPVLAKIVEPAAPLLASVLGTPLAGVAVSLLSSLFGSDPKNVGQLVTHVQNDPEATIKIKTLEYQHAEMLAKIASSDFAIQTHDVQDARAHGGEYRDFLRHMGYVVTFGFFIALILVYLPFAPQQSERELLSMLVGMLVSKWQTIIDFFYGSSQKHGGTKV